MKKNIRYCALLWLLVVATSKSQTLPSDFSDVTALTDKVEVQLAYFGSDNFVGSQIDGYQANRCYLQTKAAKALAKVAEQASQQGYRLLLKDCYRPQRAVDHFMRWAADEADIKTKNQYYPDLPKSALVGEYIAEKSGHSRGSTLDVSLMQRTSDGHWQALDMGSPYDFFGPISHVNTTQISQQQQRNRQRLIDLMQAGGFEVYSQEWWHFSLREPVYTDRYFDFVIE